MENSNKLDNIASGESTSTRPEVTRVNPLLKGVVLPGETYKLPSGGIFYTNGELEDGTVDGEVHVKPMAAFDEILLKTPDLLLSGSAIEQVFQRCIPQVVKPLELFGKDVDFLMVCLRIVTYGQQMTVEFTHDCEEAKKHEYTLNVNNFVSNAKPIDPSNLDRVYKKTMANGQVVKFHPAKMKDVIEMMQKFDPTKEITPEEQLDDTINTIISVISSVDGVTDVDFIKEWLKTISSGWVNDISTAIEETGSFGPELIHKTKCKDCGKDIELAPPINPISFFS